jgi:hypothetical protein
MRFLLPTAFLALATAACAPMEWVKADVTPEVRQKDAYECQRDAWRDARLRTWYYQPISPAVVQDPSGRRFISGPAYYGDPFNDPLMEEARLTQGCMRARGYELVPVEKR